MGIEGIFDSRFLRRKNMLCMAKVFDDRTDGPWDYESKIYSKKDRTYAKYKFIDETSRLAGYRIEISEYTIPTSVEHKYLVVCYVKKGTKKHEVLTKMGFVVMKEAS